jgi:hypothetical protein
MLPFENYIRSKKGNWCQPERRKFIRSQFRNKPKQIFDGKLVSYGALTGEKEAECFMRFGETALEDGDLVVFYTDGFENLVKEKEFSEAIQLSFKNQSNCIFLDFDKKFSEKNYDLYGHERTLTAIAIK